MLLAVTNALAYLDTELGVFAKSFITPVLRVKEFSKSLLKKWRFDKTDSKVKVKENGFTRSLISGVGKLLKELFGGKVLPLSGDGFVSGAIC
jgi:hypothetical protein